MAGLRSPAAYASVLGRCSLLLGGLVSQACAPAGSPSDPGPRPIKVVERDDQLPSWAVPYGAHHVSGAKDAAVADAIDRVRTAFVAGSNGVPSARGSGYRAEVTSAGVVFSPHRRGRDPSPDLWRLTGDVTF